VAFNGFDDLVLATAPEINHVYHCRRRMLPIGIHYDNGITVGVCEACGDCRFFSEISRKANGA
jgi:hypothetical protein